MEVKFDRIKPNLYVRGDEVYIGMNNQEVVPVSQVIDEVIEKYIGTLKVKKSDLEVLQSGSAKLTPEYDVPLRDFLDTLKKYDFENSLEITTDTAELFNLGYVIDAQTIENYREVENWKGLRQDLADPNRSFDAFEKENLVYRVDREKTLVEMKRLYEQLDSNIPENYADLFVVNGFSPVRTPKGSRLARVFFEQLKAENQTKIEGAKSELLEKLKDVDGPCLSLDAPDLIDQAIYLTYAIPKLVRRCGDVLSSSDWRAGLFRGDC